jgi:ribonuclease E
MNDAANLSNDDHWTRLANELGLEPDPDRPPPARADVAKDHADHGFEPAGDEPSAPPRGRRRRHAPEREAETTALTAGEPPAEPDLLDDEPPHSAGGRPRRGRKAADAESTDRADDESAGGATESDLETEVGEEASAGAKPVEEADKPRRRRRRSRRKKANDQPETAAGGADDTDAAATETVTADAADEDEDPAPEVIADWNVPSWNDLIASLYRPDR